MSDLPPLRLEYRLADDLEGNPLNWRTPTAEGLAAIRGAVGEVGFTGALLYNERTGRLIDGHKRKKVLAGQIVPVLVGDWDEPTERKILLYHDQLGQFSGFDAKAFEELLATPGLDTECPELLGMLDNFAAELLDADLSVPADPEPEPDPDDDDDAKPSDAVPDAVFPSDNEWDVPTLDVRMQADHFDFPFAIWGSVARRKMRGIAGFYTDDRRFSGVFERPDSLLLAPCPTVVEPNYSTHPQIPRAVMLERIYRKRWLARYWQTKGRRIFVDLNVDPTVRALNFLGVPKGWRAYFTRSHGDPAKIVSEWEAAVAHAGTDDLIFGVYGGGREVQELCRSRLWQWYPEHNETVHGRGK